MANIAPAAQYIYADFGSGVSSNSGGPFGMPITEVPAGQQAVNVSFEYAAESDPGPYPIPSNVRIEHGPNSTGDRHAILYDRTNCRLYELYSLYRQGDGTWKAGSGAAFNLRSNAMRRAGWTSADAAGLAILPGLVTYDEVAAGRIDHMIRLCVPETTDAYVWPASHKAGVSDKADAPPMGLRLRLKAAVDISKLPPQSRVIAKALKEYGFVVADNAGGSWHFGGTEDTRWNNDDLSALQRLTGSDFEVVDGSGLQVAAGSLASRQQ